MLPEQLEAGGGCGVVRLEGAPDGSGRACGEETSAFTVLLPPAPCSLAVSVRARVAVGLRYSLTEALVEAGEAAAGLEVGSRFAGTRL